MRQHIGQHIVKQEIDNHTNLCGFCSTLCGSNNTISRKNGYIKSGCEFVHFYCRKTFSREEVPLKLKKN